MICFRFKVIIERGGTRHVFLESYNVHERGENLLSNGEIK